jgi:hypothetical protein
MSNDLEKQVQIMINEGQSEEDIALFIKNSTKKTPEPPERRSNSNNNNPKVKNESEHKKRLTPHMKNKLLQLFPFAFDIALVILFSNLINSFGSGRDYYNDEILISFSTLFSMIILSKWYWSYKGKTPSVTIKDYMFYIVLFAALLFGMFYVSLLPE